VSGAIQLVFALAVLNDETAPGRSHRCGFQERVDGWN
jgi:hypothetical protein